MVYKKYLTLVISMFLVFMSLFAIFADTNGVWHETKDIRGGTFGTDEQDFTSGVGFKFLNFVQFEDKVYLMNNTGIGTLNPRTNLEISGRWFVTEHGSSPTSGVGMFGSYNPTISRGIIQVYNYDVGVKNDLGLQGAGGNVGIGIGTTDTVNEKLDVNGNVSIRGVANCPGKLYTDSTGKVICSPTVFTPIKCQNGYFMTGFAENGSVICEVIFGVCGTSHLTNTYTEPTTNLCAAGTWQDQSNTVNTYNWKCLGVNPKADESCYSNRKIDCYGSWSDTSTCSATCAGGVKLQSYTVSVPAQNGGIACPYSNGATRWGSTSCNTQSCCTPITPTIIFSDRSANGYGMGFGVWTAIEKICTGGDTYSFTVRTSCLPDDWGSCNGVSGSFCGVDAGTFTQSSTTKTSTWTIGDHAWVGCVNAGVYRAQASQASNGIVTVTNGWGNSATFNMN